MIEKLKQIVQFTHTMFVWSDPDITPDFHERTITLTLAQYWKNMRRTRLEGKILGFMVGFSIGMFILLIVRRNAV